jgi:protein TonB
MPAPAPVVEVPPPAPKPVVQPPPQPAPVVQAPRSNPVAEGAYQAKARSVIERNKHYPDDALQMGMTGNVVIVYVIDRDGRLVRAEIERSSGHSLLDQAALRAVRRSRFEAMPEDAWVGLKEQIFRTRIDFNLE